MADQLIPLENQQISPKPDRARLLFGFIQILIVIAITVTTAILGTDILIVIFALLGSLALVLMGIKMPWMLQLTALSLCSLAGVFAAIPLPGSGTFSMGTLINGSALVGTLIALSFHLRNIHWRMINSYRWFIIFAMWSLLGIFFAPGISTALKESSLYWIPILCAILVRLIVDQRPQSRKILEKFLVWINIVPLVTMFAGLYFGFIQLTELGFEGLFYARQLTLYLLVPLSITLGWWRLGETRKERFWGLIWSGIFLTVVLIGLSRTVTIIATLMVLLRFFPPKRIGHWVFIFSAGLLFFAVLLQVPQFRARFFYIGSDINQQIDWSRINTNGRSFLWPRVFEDTLDSPIIGKGTGSSRIFVASISSLDHPHNDYLRIFHDGGLIGLLFFLIAWGGRMYSDWVNWVRLERSTPSIAKYKMASFLGALSAALSFTTDNTITFSFVLIPLFTIIALSDSVENR
jgi:O-antigen ligase